MNAQAALPPRALAIALAVLASSIVAAWLGWTRLHPIAGIALWWAPAWIWSRGIAVPVQRRQPAGVLAAGWGRDVCVAQSLVLTWWWYPWLFGQALPAPLRTLLAAILGARFGRGSVAFGKLHDPGLVSVGSGTLIGEDALLAATAWQHGGILLAPIRIGDGVLVGGRSILNPGVVIGDGATIAAGAVVLTGTQVAPGELWGGVPARRLKGAT